MNNDLKNLKIRFSILTNLNHCQIFFSFLKTSLALSKKNER